MDFSVGFYKMKKMFHYFIKLPHIINLQNGFFVEWNFVTFFLQMDQLISKRKRRCVEGIRQKVKGKRYQVISEKKNGKVHYK